MSVEQDPYGIRIQRHELGEYAIVERRFGTMKGLHNGYLYLTDAWKLKADDYTKVRGSTFEGNCAFYSSNSLPFPRYADVELKNNQTHMLCDVFGDELDPDQEYDIIYMGRYLEPEDWCVDNYFFWL